MPESDNQRVLGQSGRSVRVRFGSADSRDTDVLYTVESLPDPVECKAFCSNAPENRNLAVIRKGIISETYKGLPDETNNAIRATWSLHPQDAPNPVLQSVKRIVPLKVVRATRMILAMLTRTQHREAVKAALSSNNVARRHEMLATIDFSSLELSTDAAKTIAFQLGQTNALIDGVELYTKSEIQDRFPGLAPLIGREHSSLQHLNEQRDALLEKLDGVYVRQKGNLNLHMYGNALAIGDWNQYARQCRGMIIDVARERCVFFPMDKFFRFGEGPELAREAFPADLPVEVVEKVDGSMVSLIEHGGQRQFSCKGNFDTEQSLRAAKIAESLPIDRLNTDEYWHVFEVIYPENRFPRGLSIVDYGAREDLVLTAMRDRLTNELLPYSDVVREARRAGLSHPNVFQGGLCEAFKAVDLSDSPLGTEGFVIRTVGDGRYFKLKYPAYKDVLRLVNDMRSRRFVREFLGMNADARAATVAMLPEDIREIGHQQLAEHTQIDDRLREYSAAVRKLIQGPPQELAIYVRTSVPEELQKLIFHENRGLDATTLIEKAALEIYEGKRQLPEPPLDA